MRCRRHRADADPIGLRLQQRGQRLIDARTHHHVNVPAQLRCIDPNGVLQVTSSANLSARFSVTRMNALEFHFVTRCYPRIKAAEQRTDVYMALVDQISRHRCHRRFI